MCGLGKLFKERSALRTIAQLKGSFRGALDAQKSGQRRGEASSDLGQTALVQRNFIGREWANGEG